MKTFGKVRHIHFVGIGGIGMSGIAELLLNLGYKVSGSDIKDSKVTERISRLGGKIFLDHKKENILDADVVVFSSAVPVDNPEIVEARESSIPVIPRAEMLAELMRLKYGISVAGAHGKTTTTSMIASILTAGNLDPTVVIGGRLDIWGGSNAKLGQGDILVAESDESDGSFMALSPTIAVVTNVDLEHVDYYGSMEAIREAFIRFINKIPFYGTSILCMDNEEIQGIIPFLKKRYITYGMAAQADIRAKDIRGGRFESDFEVLYMDKSLGRVSVGMPGVHNVLNALAAISVGLELEMDLKDIRAGLKNLGGLERRFQIKGESGGILIVDDYGHHPSEIQATLATAKECWPDKRLVVAFQPHRYTRTSALFDRFAISFNDADVLIVSPIYSAGEKPIQGIDSEFLYNEIKKHGHRDVILCSSNEVILPKLMEIGLPGDVILTLGAGDIYLIGNDLLEKLEKKGLHS
ncbi:MAG: UDP-N-acetylmuramate--L-alanine ligase [Deltaproteobacteria bacterium]|nr:UDP-N-acetylmuramate--L-alanine ligase [Deltaproteobacteria bacterium]